MNKLISTIVLACFLFNTAFSDLAFGLAAPSRLCDINGLQANRMAKLEFELERLLRIDAGYPNSLDESMVRKSLNKPKTVHEKTIFVPAEMTFSDTGTPVTNGRLCVKCKIKEDPAKKDPAVETYYAAVSLSYNEDLKGFPIYMYTAQDVKGTYKNDFVKLLNELPTRKPHQDAAIKGYVAHERSSVEGETELTQEEIKELTAIANLIVTSVTVRSSRQERKKARLQLSSSGYEAKVSRVIKAIKSVLLHGNGIGIIEKQLSNQEKFIYCEVSKKLKKALPLSHESRRLETTLEMVSHAAQPSKQPLKSNINIEKRVQKMPDYHSELSPNQQVFINNIAEDYPILRNVLAGVRLGKILRLDGANIIKYLCPNLDLGYIETLLWRAREPLMMVDNNLSQSRRDKTTKPADKNAVIVVEPTELDVMIMVDLAIEALERYLKDESSDPENQKLMLRM